MSLALSTWSAQIKLVQLAFGCTIISPTYLLTYLLILTWWPIASRIRAFDWFQTQLPWPWRAIMQFQNSFRSPAEKFEWKYFKIDPYYQRRSCSLMTLDSSNIRFMRIFTVVLEIYVHFPYTYAYACAYLFMYGSLYRTVKITLRLFCWRQLTIMTSLLTIDWVIFRTDPLCGK